MSWPKGTIVVCIDDRWPAGMGALDFLVPKEGQHYTINEDGIAEDTGEPSVTLIEARSEQWAYPRHHFRTAEGGASERERAQALRPIEVGKALIASAAMGLLLMLALACDLHGVDIPPWVMRGIAAIETSSEWRDIDNITYRDRRVGEAGEVGPWQLSPAALRDLKAYDKRDRIHSNVVLAESMTRAWLLRCHTKAGNWFDAVVIYHVGPAGDRQRGRNYAERVKAAGTTTN